MFEASDEVRLDRNQNPHLGFGFGTHRCVGSMFAKLEMRVALKELLSRYERFELSMVEDSLGRGKGETKGFTRLPLKVQEQRLKRGQR